VAQFRAHLRTPPVAEDAFAFRKRSADPRRRAASFLLGVVVHAVVVSPCAACGSAALLGPGF